MTEYYAQCRPFMDKSWIKYNGSDDLDAKSPAPLLTFCMYRAQENNTYPIENVKMGTLGGMMWYLHNEIVSCVYDDCDNVRRTASAASRAGRCTRGPARRCTRPA